ncbi:hypothetical protein BELL_1629g00010 [Botrytis elliptica]|uniref:Uncharacterized protein n=1 Tax=Botrytis elliptica TaxID=278938 RepID=A0A4Z1I2C3_9HELO|nr:hypothetical protein BELL_1629g00010 [Botrytis elliptica]
MPYVFDPAAIIDSLGPTTIGEQFEKDRMDVGEDLRDLVESRPYYEAYHDKSESRDLIKVTAEPLEWVAAIFEESQDCLRFKLGEMKTLLLQIQYANWPYRQFPYVPKCLLYICAFALAHSLVADGNPISKIVWLGQAGCGYNAGVSVEDVVAHQHNAQLIQKLDHWRVREDDVEIVFKLVISLLQKPPLAFEFAALTCDRL